GDPPTVDVSKSPVPSKKITDVGADYMGWGSDSKTITWAVGSTFLRLPLERVIFEAPKKPDEKEKPEQKESEAKPKPEPPTPPPPRPPEPPKTQRGKKSSVDRETTASSGADESDKKESDKKEGEKKPKPEETPVRLEFPRHHPSGTVVLRGAQVITMG